MKCLAQTQGPKIRVNSVLPGLLLTEWVSPWHETNSGREATLTGGQGNQYSQEFIKKWEDDTPLKSIVCISRLSSESE